LQAACQTPLSNLFISIDLISGNLSQTAVSAGPSARLKSPIFTNRSVNGASTQVNRRSAGANRVARSRKTHRFSVPHRGICGTSL